MTLTQLAFCFASAVVGAVVGVMLLFALAKPKAIVTLDLTLRGDPKCPGCGQALGAKQLLDGQKASDEFEVTMRR